MALVHCTRISHASARILDPSCTTCRFFRTDARGEPAQAYHQAIADLKATGALPEQVERETRSNPSVMWWSKTTVLSSGWSSRGWASFPSRARGGPCEDMRPCT